MGETPRVLEEVNLRMLDTARIASPPLSESVAREVEQALVRRSATDLATGTILYEFTSGQLSGSWDSRISVQVERERWTATRLKQQKNAAYKVASEPYLVIEGSVHKALLGHNVYGGPLSPSHALCWFVEEISARLGVSLPSACEWIALRLDWAEAFELPSFEAVEEYITGLNAAQFPRRSVVRYGAESLSAPGRTTTVKAYHKGPEFSAHDSKRLRDWMDPAQRSELQGRANRILRLETSIKARKLAEDFDGKPQVVQVAREYLESVHDREAARLLKEACSDMQIVRTHREVSRRLEQIYGGELGNRLFGTWLQLAALGDTEVRKRVSRPTYYRHRKQLMDAGCSWSVTDVIVLKTSALPVGFSPVREDPHRLIDEAEEVSYKIGTFLKAA